MLKPWGRWKAKTHNPWLLRTWRRVYRRNQNLLVLVYGETGSGKTYTCLKLARMIDPHFTLKQVVFDIDQFFKLLNSNTLHQGSVVIFEELGVAANARKWFSDENQWMSFVNQVFRTRNLIVFYTVPKLDMVDSQLAKLTHAHIEADHIDFRSKRNCFKIFDPVEYDEKGRKWFRHQVAYRRMGRTFKTKLWTVKRVNLMVAREYEKIRKGYETQLTKSAGQAIDDATQRAAERKRTLSPKELESSVDDVINNRKDYMDDGRFYTDRVMSKFTVGLPNARRIKEKVRERLVALGFLVQWK